jgi:hypothetical protein
MTSSGAGGLHKASMGAHPAMSLLFGRARQASGSHRVYKTPWSGDPRVNIQNSKGRAKAYQVRQVLRAIERLEIEHGAEE